MGVSHAVTPAETAGVVETHLKSLGYYGFRVMSFESDLGFTSGIGFECPLSDGDFLRNAWATPINLTLLEVDSLKRRAEDWLRSRTEIARAGDTGSRLPAR